jgi:glycerol-3-phosphate dehydrogenase
MQRNFSKLNSEIFDILIVGSGIHGAILAFEAARAGYRIALVDKSDFGSSTSANSLKIIHGGIRYLQHLNFKRMRESILSRRAMMRFAPHLVKPLSCLMPTYGHGIKGRELMRIAFYLYDLIAFDRNLGLSGDSLLPQGGALSRAECQKAIRGIREGGLNGAALWHDAVAVNTERLLMEYVNEASRYGSVTVNYAEAKRIAIEENEVHGVFVRDILTGNEVLARAKTVINTSGPWVDSLLKPGTDLPHVSSGKWAKAINIVVKRRFFGNYAVGLEGWSEYRDKDAFIKRGKRLFFFVPWRDQ